jgi:hypothetical protein
MNKHISIQSLLVEYATKVAMILYMSSAFYFVETIDPINNLEVGRFNFYFILRFVVLVFISMFLLVVRGDLFKKLDFLLIMVAAFYKILMIISSQGFYWYQFLSLSDSLMVMGLALYYSYRHAKKVKYTEHSKKRRRKIGKLKNTVEKEKD